MSKISAGLLMFKVTESGLAFFLVHPGGPFFKNKQKKYWTIPKGEPEPGEPLLETARREFFEETGIEPLPPFYELGHIKQAGGKTVHAWAFQFKEETLPRIVSNVFEIEWPPRSGKFKKFPEADQAGLYLFEEAAELINPAQVVFLEKLKNLTEKIDLN